MKKYFSLLLLTLAGFSFMACEDVPAPYGINLEAAPKGSLAAGQVLNEPLTNGLGAFQVKTPSGLYAWAYEGHDCIQISSFVDKVNYDADSYLISPAVTLEDKDYHFSFEYILRYALETTVKKNHTVVISDNYDGDPSTATWTVLDLDMVQGSDWDNWYKADINIPDTYRGKTVNIAFHYIGETAKAATWEVRKAILAEGKAPASADDAVGDVTFFSEPFSSGLGDFTQNVVLPAGSSSLWTFDSGYSCAKVTGYNNQTSTATATEAWLISPVIDLRKATGAYLSFEHACNKFTAAMSSQATIWAKTTSATEWTQLTPENYPTSWTFVKSGNINLEAFIGKKMQFAFKYVSSTSSAGTWEVKKVQVTGFGEAGTNGIGWEDFTNGGFDQWDATGVKAEGWQEDNAIGDADIARSEDAHTAPYACLVKGNAAISRSLAYEAMAFPAGTYTVSFYAKAASDTAKLRVGYRVKGEEKDRMERDAEDKLVNHIVGAVWEQISYTFTLEASADVTVYSVALIIRNMKNDPDPKDILIDDVTISKAE